MSETHNPPWRVLPDGLAVSVRATPRGGRDAIDGIAQLGDGRAAVKVRVRAAPADGDANDAVARVIAGAAGVPPSAVKLLQGAAGRSKTFRVVGDPIKLAAALERVVAGAAKRK